MNIRHQEQTWHQVYEQTVQRFGGQTPGKQLENDLIQAFEQHPGDLQVAIDRTAERFAKAQVHSPWPIVIRELEKSRSRHDVHASDTADKERLTQLAERYITNAGLYLPTETDLLDALTGQHGPLKTWAGDQALEQRLVDRWQHEQPRADQARTDYLERAAHFRQARATAVNDQPTAPAADPDPDRRRQAFADTHIEETT